jgi:hypothetical protein
LQKLTDWLQENQTAVAILGPVGAALSAVGMRLATSPVWLGIFIALLMAFTAAPAIAVRVNRLQQGRRAAEHCVKRLLQACGHSFGHPIAHVRVNIMKFSPDGHRRKVDAATAFNMDEDPDSDLELDAHAGVGGQAAFHRRPAFGDIVRPLEAGGPDWGLRPAEQARVRPGLQSILSVPVFNRLDPDGPLLGTLQIDSDQPLVASGFHSEEKRQMAERFADVVSLLLETGR